jgi:hypothetical protein
VKLPSHFPKWLYHFSLPQTIYESSSCTIFLQKLGIINLFNFSHSAGCVLVSHYGFNLHFSDKMLSFSCGYWHSHIFLYKVSVQILCLFKKQVLLLSCLYILDTNSFSNIVLYFLLICALPFHFLNCVFPKNKFLILMKSCL